jgi:hypothetical protein
VLTKNKIKIKDRVTLALVGALIGVCPGHILNRFLIKKGIVDYRYDRLGAGMFLEKYAANSRVGQLTGIIVNELNGALLSLVITYALSITGRDKTVLKGVGIGLSSWVLINGFLSGSILGKKSVKPWVPLINAAFHMVSGCLIGITVSKLGDDSLFPDMMGKNTRDMLPVMPLEGVNRFP